MRPIHVIAPPGTVVNARPPAAVAGGNVETSQRIVDVLLKALAQAIPDRIPAAASGTMNNLTIGGIDPRYRRALRLLRNHRRRHGRAPHERWRLRRPHPHDKLAQHSRRSARICLPGSPAAIFFSLQKRRRRACTRAAMASSAKSKCSPTPRSLCSPTAVPADPTAWPAGHDGAPGRTVIVRNDGSEEELPGKTSVRLRSGERVRIESPGGGGWGRAKR